MSDCCAYDIHDNLIFTGDYVYVLTTPSAGSRYKRLFNAEVVEISKHGKFTVRCVENGRVTNVFSPSVIKPYPHGMYTQGESE